MGYSVYERQSKWVINIEKLKFYDVKAKKTFFSDKYKIVNKKGRRFAVAETDSGTTAYRILPKE